MSGEIVSLPSPKLLILVHVAVIEWPDDSIDPTLFADIDMDRLLADIRDAIEAQATTTYPDEWEEYVADHVGDGSDYDEWYEVLHDIGDSPWVTIETKEI
jgi:hypothetical protein